MDCLEELNELYTIYKNQQEENNKILENIIPSLILYMKKFIESQEKFYELKSKCRTLQIKVEEFGEE